MATFYPPRRGGSEDEIHQLSRLGLGTTLPCFALSGSHSLRSCFLVSPYRAHIRSAYARLRPAKEASRKLGARPDAIDNAEKAMTSIISGIRRPYLSAINPNRNAPTGRNASVMVIVKATSAFVRWNSFAISVSTITTTK